MAQKMVGIRVDVGVIRGLELRAHQAFTPGDKKHAAKAAARASGNSTWAFCDEKIRADGSLKTYFPVWARFAKWAREHHHANKWGALAARADELATAYLSGRLVEEYAPNTLNTEREALRLLFENRQLAESVILPERTGDTITKSRGPAKRDAGFQPNNWKTMIGFVRAVGTRRAELRNVRVSDVWVGADGLPVSVHVGWKKSGKGGKGQRKNNLSI